MARVHLDTGAVLLHGRLLGNDQVGEHPGTVHASTAEGTLGLNTYPEAFAAVPIAPGDLLSVLSHFQTAG